MLQRMPLPTGTELTTEDEERVEDAWRTGVVLMGSVTNDELLSTEIPPSEVLRRLFHSEGLVAYDARHPHFGCRCSRDRVASALVQFPRSDLDTMKTDSGVVEVTCEFCNETYPFTDADLDALEAAKASEQ